MELFYNPNYFNTEELIELKNHTYSTTGYSKLDNIMNPYWEFCSKLLPHVINNFIIKINNN